MRTVEEINDEIKKLLEERSNILKTEKRNNIENFIGKYIKYTQNTELYNTLIPFKECKTYIMKVNEAKNPGNNYFSFSGPGIIIEKSSMAEEFYTMSLNMHLFILQNEQLKDVQKISEEEFFEYSNKVNSIYNKLKNINSNLS